MEWLEPGLSWLLCLEEPDGAEVGGRNNPRGLPHTPAVPSLPT